MTWTVTDPAGNSSSAPQTVIVAERVPTSIAYAGTRKGQIGKPFSFGVVLSASEASCVGGLPLTFSLDRDPVTGEAGPADLGDVDDEWRRSREADRWYDGLVGGKLRADRWVCRKRPRLPRIVNLGRDHLDDEGRAEPVG